MQDEIAIKVDNVSKDFILPHEKVNTVKGVFTSAFRRGRTKSVQHALRGVSFEVKKGEFFGIVGRNGSGKSTMLKMLAGIYQPTKGSLKVNGKLVPFIELGVGFNPELTGRENVYLNGAMMGFSKKETDDMYEDIVAFAELEKFMDQKLKNYSSGMQVRLAFSVAIKAEADVLLIDEVLAVGDADFQRKCYDYFKKLKKDKKTVIFVSHDMGAVKEFCDRAIMIEDSRLISEGLPSEIANQYADLFMSKETSDVSLNQLDESRRSGNGLVRIKEVRLDKSLYTDKDQKLKMKISVEAFDRPSELMIGFAVKSPAGQIINGYHTWENSMVLPQLGAGDSLSTNWELTNIYEDGLYTIDVYSYGSEHVVYDLIEDAISFRAKRRNRSGCLVILPVDIQIGAVKKS